MYSRRVINKNDNIIIDCTFSRGVCSATGVFCLLHENKKKNNVYSCIAIAYYHHTMSQQYELYYLYSNTKTTMKGLRRTLIWKILDSSFYRRSTNAEKKQRQQIDLLLYLTGQSCNTHLIGNAHCAFVVLSYVFANQSTSHHAPGLLRVWQSHREKSR